MNKTELVKIEIHNYSEHYSKDIADLFYKSVRAIDVSIYTDEQKAAWAPAPIDYAYWSARLKTKQPFVALVEKRVAGFIELDADGHIDCTCTHPDFQGMGVASALYEHMLAEAMRRDMKRLYVEASIIAKPFFEYRGFSVSRKNEVQRNGVSLVNFSMEKNLSPLDA